MAQITSREELREWLKDKPVDWAQVIAVRAALRVFPYAFRPEIDDGWVNHFALTSIRALFISWVACTNSAHEMTAAAAYARGYASRAPSPTNRVVYNAASNAANNAISSVNYFTTDFLDAAYAVSVAAADDAGWADYSTVWEGVERDRIRLYTEGGSPSAARRVMCEKLWPATMPVDLAKTWQYAIKRLANLDQGYQIWIDWYERRIRGKRAAFDIPGDSRRKDDKAILARLADTTDEDFWDKGATYVNTTLQGWIDEARERVAATDSVSGDDMETTEIQQPVVSDRINFFISYATVDEAMAREVEAVLAELGYTSIAQFKDFKQSSFVRSMREGLAKSERFIALYSKAYWSSDHCQSEWDAAYARDPGAKQRKIVPFLLEAMDLRQQPLASEIVYERLHGLSKDERKEAIKQMIEFQPNARLA
jgi:TIR domain